VVKPRSLRLVIDMVDDTGRSDDELMNLARRSIHCSSDGTLVVRVQVLPVSTGKPDCNHDCEFCHVLGGCVEVCMRCRPPGSPW
jgi:hypothetical protein